MTPEELETYLYGHIPISQALGVRVLATEPEIRLRAPLAPNLNHRNTAFGGSLGAVATLAAWSALRVRLGDSARLVIARQATEFLAPVAEDFEATASVPEGEAWEAFQRAYARKGRARLDVEARVTVGEVVAVRLVGTFAALADRP
jgi:thioesterase domain-containing protein